METYLLLSFVVGIIGVLYCVFKNKYPFNGAYESVKTKVLNTDPTLLFVIGVLIAFIIIGYYAFYFIIEIYILFFIAITVVTILYKSKPSRQSFNEFKINFEKCGNTVMKNMDADKLHQQQFSWFLGAASRLYMHFAAKITLEEPVIFDIIIGLIAYTTVSSPMQILEKDKDKKQTSIMFLGIGGAWIPISRTF